MRTGIIFDMDGTLWNSAKEVATAWSTVSLKKLGRAVSEADMYRVMGMTMDELAKALFPDRDLAEVLKVMEESAQVENDYLAVHGARLYPGVEEALAALCKDYPLSIVSNCQQGYIEVFLEYYRFGKYFEDHLCFGDNGLQKSENIARIMERNRLDRAVYVGDIQADYDAASAGGAAFVHAAYGFGTVDADVPRIYKMAELPQLMQSLFPA